MLLPPPIPIIAMLLKFPSIVLVDDRYSLPLLCVLFSRVDCGVVACCASTGTMKRCASRL
jgi:hypothetical protein